ncbi:MAG: hypothetical protein HOY71_40720, partial [Nonomuraea sp.]|nr:hypothetical protein [Nonomuraea sp.]
MLDSLPDMPPTPAEPVTIEPVRRDGDTLYASGQVAMADGELIATGPVTDLDT